MSIRCSLWMVALRRLCWVPPTDPFNDNEYNGKECVPPVMDLSSLSPVFDQIATICRVALSEGGPVMGTLFLAGLAGGASHCAGMCGPFVLAQATAGAAAQSRESTGRFYRLRGAALLPYHCGRATTYAALGALVAGLAGGAVAFTRWRWLAAGFLVLAALLFLGQGAAALTRWHPWAGKSGRIGPLARGLTRLARPFLADPRGVRGYGLGVLLGFLPCGLLYGALAGAAAAGGAAAGALAMLAFTAGTVPALMAVGFAGHFFGRRWGDATRLFGGLLMVVNTGLLLILAWRVAP